MSLHYIREDVTERECAGCLGCNWQSGRQGLNHCKGTGKIVTRACRGCVDGTINVAETKQCPECNGSGRVPYEGDGREIEVWLHLGPCGPGEDPGWLFSDRRSGMPSSHPNSEPEETEAEAIAAARKALGEEDQG